MKHVRLSLALILLMVVTTNATDLYSQEADSTKYPKVTALFWSLPRETSQYYEPGPGGGWGDSGEQGDFIEEAGDKYSWQSDSVKFLRRFDVLHLGMNHIITWNKEYDDYSPTLVCSSLNHVFFDTSYNHDGANGHGGSAQEILGKSEGGLIMMGQPQQILASFELQKVNTGHFNAAVENPQRELVDWLSPGWFALAVGDTLIENISNETDSLIWIRLSDPDSVQNFEHECWQDSTHDNCAAIAESSYSNSENYEVWRRTYVMILPFEEDLWNMPLDSCKGNPHYEIMKVIAIEGDSLHVARNRFNTPRFSYSRGQEIRPIIWANPNNWGDEAFFLNLTTEAPPAMLDGQGPFHWYDIGALFVRNHHLRAKETIDFPPGTYEDTTFWLADGLWSDAYQANGLKRKVVQQSQFLHAGKLDYNLDGIPDCQVEGEEVTCDSLLVEAWKAGYADFFYSVRAYTKDVRDDSTAFTIITNGHPDSSQFQYVNGRHFEDTNGFFHDGSWLQVLRRSREYEDDPDFVDPRLVTYFERDFRWLNYTNLAQMRLTMAVSLLATDIGVYGTAGGGYNSRSDSLLVDDAAIEDYYDEYAVDFEGRGFQNVDFQEEYWDPQSPSYLSDSLLYAAKYYLGAPLDTMKSCAEDTDVIYREFDHGLVIAHLGICEREGEGPLTLMDVDLDWLDLVEDPRDCNTCEGSPCHFLRIQGYEAVPFSLPYNDGTNDGEHVVDSELLVDRLYDDEVYGRGDALILLKENDGFKIHEDHYPPPGP